MAAQGLWMAFLGLLALILVVLVLRTCLLGAFGRAWGDLLQGLLYCLQDKFFIPPVQSLDRPAGSSEGSTGPLGNRFVESVPSGMGPADLLDRGPETVTLKELLEVVVRIMRDSSPRGAYYGEALREHMARAHQDLLDENVKVE